MAVTIIKKNISLNVAQPNNFELICAMQGDNKAFEITATIYDDNKLYDISGTLRLKGTNPIGENIYKTVDSYTNHTITFTLTESMLRYDGLLRLVIVMTNGGTQVTTFPFIIKVVNSPGNTSEDDIVAISALVEEAEKWANISKSYAVGTDDVVRDGDSTDNSKYYCEQSKKNADSSKDNADESKEYHDKIEKLLEAHSVIYKYKTTIEKNENQSVFHIQHNLDTEDVWVTMNDGISQVDIDWIVEDKDTVKFSFYQALDDNDKYYITIFGIRDVQLSDLDDINTKQIVYIPSINDSIYTGESLVPVFKDFDETKIDIITDISNIVNIGTYDIELKLKDSNLYEWFDSDSDIVTIEWNVIELKKIYLYNEGDECTDLTGGIKLFTLLDGYNEDDINRENYLTKVDNSILSKSNNSINLNCSSAVSLLANYNMDTTTSSFYTYVRSVIDFSNDISGEELYDLFGFSRMYYFIEFDLQSDLLNNIQSENNRPLFIISNYSNVTYVDKNDIHPNAPQTNNKINLYPQKNGNNLLLISDVHGVKSTGLRPIIINIYHRNFDWSSINLKIKKIWIQNILELTEDQQIQINKRVEYPRLMEKVYDTRIIYDGTKKNLLDYYNIIYNNEADKEKMEITGDFTAIEVGTYCLTFNLKEGFAWNNDLTNDYKIYWYIYEKPAPSMTFIIDGEEWTNNGSINKINLIKENPTCEIEIKDMKGIPYDDNTNSNIINCLYSYPKGIIITSINENKMSITAKQNLNSDNISFMLKHGDDYAYDKWFYFNINATGFETERCYLYNEGDECVDITGGWIVGSYNGINANTQLDNSCTAIKRNNYIELSCNSNNLAKTNIIGAACFIKNKSFNCLMEKLNNGYTNIYFDIEYSLTSNDDFCITFGNFNKRNLDYPFGSMYAPEIYIDNQRNRDQFLINSRKVFSYDGLNQGSVSDNDDFIGIDLHTWFPLNDNFSAIIKIYKVWLE